MTEYIPADDITERLEAQLKDRSRNPFISVLADGLANAPTPEDWQELAKQPDKWARAIGGLAKPAGFGERIESLQVKLDATQAVNALIAKHGPEAAVEVCQRMGIPEAIYQAQLPVETNTQALIDHETDSEHE